MAIEIHCPGCGRTLRIADEHRGKQIRCPACQQISTVSPNEETSGSTGVLPHTSTPDRTTRWHLRMPDGPVYGPIGWNDILNWAAEGRIAADCELAESSNGPWRGAAELLPSLAGINTPGNAAAVPSGYPWAVNTDQPTTAGYVAPHRGGLVLLLGLLGWMGCPIFSFAAWVMGTHDLREMRAGRMDKSGESLTLAGLVFGMIVSVIWILVLALAALIAIIVVLGQW